MSFTAFVPRPCRFHIMMDTLEFLFTSKPNGFIIFLNEKLNFIEHLVHFKGALTNYIAIFTKVKVQTRVRNVEKI